MVHMLLEEDVCVSGIARALNISKAAVSQHLKLLRAAGIVNGIKHGYFMHYHIERSVLKDLSFKLEQMSEITKMPDGTCTVCEQDSCRRCHAYNQAKM